VFRVQLNRLAVGPRRVIAQALRHQRVGETERGIGVRARKRNRLSKGRRRSGNVTRIEPQGCQAGARFDAGGMPRAGGLGVLRCTGGVARRMKRARQCQARGQQGLVQAQRRFELGDRSAKLTRVLQEHAQIRVRARRARIQRHRTLELRPRLLRTAQRG
jgi:hypothetical protein